MTAKNKLHRVYEKITQDERYLRNIDWGQARAGHPEGKVANHIHQLHKNLVFLWNESFFKDIEEYYKLQILIAVHDTFKAEAKKGSAILDPNSHASLAKKFLSEFLQDGDLLNMVQYHDEPYALYKKEKLRNKDITDRKNKLCGIINDWDLFLSFNIIDSACPGKSPEPMLWTVDQFEHLTRKDISYILMANKIIMENKLC